MRQSLGLTLIEVLAVTTIIALTWAVAGHSDARSISAEARQLAHTLTRVRAASVAAGVSVAVFGNGCPPSPIPAIDLRTMGFVAALPPRGLLFTPDGLPRTCDGGGVGNTTILLEHRGRQAAVIVSSLGRVRWELR